MATTQKKLDVTELDFDRIKSNLKTFMKNQTEFTDYDFEGSGLNALLDVLSYNTHYLAMNMNMVANESFLDTASTRSAVVSHAKTLGYTPNSPRAPVAFINVTLNNSTTDSSAFEELNTATIPIGTVFTTQMDDVNYQFVTVSEHTINKVDDVLSFTNIPIYEGTYVTNRYTVNNQNVDQKFYLADRNGDTSTLVVDVFDSATSTSSTTFTLATDTTLTSSTSNVFFLQESVDGKFEIYFGDGITGRAVSDGNIVRLRYVVTNKTLANGATSFSTTATISGITNVTVATVSNASGGAEAESIQSIKFNAPLDYAAQGRAVTVNDFKAIVPKVYANTKSVQVYGGEDNDVPTFGKVYISIVPTTGSITAAAKAQIVKDLKTTYTIASVSPEVVDPEYTKLRLNVTFTYNSKNTIKPKETLESNVLTTITNFNNNNLSKFDSAFRHSAFTKLVDDTDDAITSNITTVTLSKDFTPTLDKETKYIIPFNNKLYNPHSGHDSEAGGILSSTGFKIDGNINEMFLNDDGMGNVRMFYITDGTTNTYEDNTVGTIDYFNGSITLTNLKITEVSNVDGVTSTKVRLIVKPESSDIIAVRNQVLEIDLSNSVVTAAVDTIATGSSSAGVGVATTSIYSGASNTAASSTTSTTTSSSTSTSSSGSSSSSGY
tara:strand:- start:80 stop:2065 length:1986 start_codon:yes stop_codon:yes gene_type:complete